MGAPVTKLIHVALDVNQLSNQDLEDLITAILQIAPLGSLYTANPPIAEAVAELGAAEAVYKAAGVVVIADETKLAADKQVEADARAAMITKLIRYRGLVETTAKTPAEVVGAGVSPRQRTFQGPNAAAPGVDIFYPKKGHNRAKVIAQATSRTQRFNAQFCLDLTQNVWTDLPGDGRSHWLTGYKSGALVWVRYRTVRGHQFSDWGAPTVVTIP